MQEVTKYEYKVELLNYRNTQLSVIRESVSEFIEGDCWGYPKFMYIEDIYNEGYLDPNEEKIEIKFYIRPPFYLQQARDQEKYIKKLETKMKAMKCEMDNYKKMCNEKGINIDNKHENTEINIEENKKKDLKLDEVIKNVKIDPHSCSNSEGNESDNDNNIKDANNKEDIESMQRNHNLDEDDKQIEIIDTIKKNNINEEEKYIKDKSKDVEEIHINDNVDELYVKHKQSEDAKINEELKSENDSVEDDEIKSDLDKSSDQNDSLRSDNDKILKEISNKYSIKPQISKKVLLKIKTRKGEEGNFEENLKFSPIIKGELSDNETPDEQFNRSNISSNYMGLDDIIISDDE